MRGDAAAAFPATQADVRHALHTQETNHVVYIQLFRFLSLIRARWSCKIEQSPDARVTEGEGPAEQGRGRRGVAGDWGTGLLCM